MVNRTFISQASRYFIVGGSCAIIDFALLYYLTTAVDLNYLVSSVISFMTGAIVNYFLCVTWIFKTRVVSNRYFEFLLYLVITAIGLFINTGLVWFFTEKTGFYFMLSKFFATGITFVWNFCARKFLLHTNYHEQGFKRSEV
ncbi:MAG TPA: GtrA family protein [Marinilabiliaceae bacterium]|nr:GtrA family protein [Marinilabiliaceae bacterium]